MSLRRRLPTALALLLGALVSRTAAAQTLTLPDTAKGVDWQAAHSLPHVDWINRQDCIDDPLIRFNIGLGSSTAVFIGYEIQAWIGVGCDTLANRQGSSPPCKMIGSSNIDLRRIDISVQKLLGSTSGETTDTGGTGGTTDTGGSAGLGGTGGSAGTLGLGGTLDTGTGGVSGTFGDTGGTLGSGGLDFNGLAAIAGAGGAGGLGGLGAAAGDTSASGVGGVDGTAGDTSVTGVGGTAGDTSVTGVTGGTGGTAGSAVEPDVPSVCDGDPSLPAATSRTVFFMALNSENTPAPAPSNGWVAKWTFKYDLVGPQAPVGVKAGIGEDALVLNWTEATDVASDIHYYYFLCDPPPGSGTPNVGAAGADGTDGTDGTTSSDTCESAAFKEGDIGTQAVVNAYKCGEAQATATTAEAHPLTNFVPYSVAIVAQDDFNNYGPISNLTCATPEPVTDFYEAYRADGGRGGGGFCSIAGRPTHALTALLMGSALTLFMRRRARKRSGTQDQS